MNLKTILSGLAIALCINIHAASKTAKITIDSKVKYQHVTGFGGFSPSPQWSYWLGDSEMDKLFGKGENQLGLNILRVYIANNKNFWGSGVGNVKRAKKYGAFVFASPWSPPASWKTNGETANGGSLKEDYYDDWAKFLNDYYVYMKGQGANVDAVSIQNEPDWNATYESCIWTGTQMAKFLREQGAKIQCKIIAPEAIHFTRSMHEPILNDPEACAELDILGGHFYGWDGSSYPLAAQKGKEVWMTEFLINERQEQQGAKTVDWKTDGFLFARSINDAMLANMSAWVHYSLKRYYGCLGDGKFGTTENAITKRGYILSHYAKYVSGSTRIRHSLEDSTGKLTGSTYLSVTGDSIIVMLLNTGSDSFTTTIDLPFNTQGGRQIITTETQNVKKTTLTYEEETHTPVMEVAPYSVNTYIFTKSSAREDMPEEGKEAENVFADQFDIYGASCIPAGWKSKFEGGTRGEGSYSSGPRIMSFSAEGIMPYAFYFRSGTDGVGYVTYGEDSKNRLMLEAGQYTLYYSTIGWKAKPSVTASVSTVKSKRIKSGSGTPKTMISANGSASRITEATGKELDFEITEAGEYILKWQVPQATGGLNEMLVGNIYLVKHEENNEDVIIPLNLPTDNNLYDMNGRRIMQAPQRGIYFQNGKKILK